MSDLSLNDCRRDFEIFAAGKGADLTRLQFPLARGIYEQGITQAAWESWKACWDLCDARVKGCLA